MQTISKQCKHCQLPTVENEDFCCLGCKAAFNFIQKSGLGSYYQNRFLSLKEINLKPQNQETDFDISEFINQNQHGNFEAYFLIKGLHCAACIWLIENILKQQKNVKTARINMSNKRLHLVWDGKRKDGNELVNLINNLGYRLVPYDIEELQAEEKKYNNDLVKAMCVAGFGAGNIMLMSVALWSSTVEQMGIFTHNFLYILSAIIALPVILYSGRIFFKSAWRSLKSGGFGNMDVAISVAIILIVIVSLFEVALKARHAYFDSAVMLIFFLLIGRYLDFSARKKANFIARDFAILSSVSAVILNKNGQSQVILSKNIKKNMVLLVAVGDKIAADGVIIQGKSEIDTSLITGETTPQKVSENSEVFAGTINLGQPLQIKVTKNQRSSLMAQISNLVTSLENKKSQYVRFADKIAKYYTPIVHLLALTAFALGYFYFKLPLHQALLNAVATLVITCPCGIALAVPVVNVVANSSLLKKGIIVKSGEALEKLAKVGIVIFDKTGTLTLGKPILHSAILISPNGEKTLEPKEEIFVIARKIAAFSNHPLAKSLSEKKFEHVPKTGFYPEESRFDLKIKEIVGQGLQAEFQGQEIKLGRKEFVLNEKEQSLIKANLNPQFFVKFGSEIAVFTFTDSLKEDARAVIQDLKNQQKRLILLSGDKEEVVTAIANDLNISEFYFAKTPIEKAEIIQTLKEDPKNNILMCGDGINDAPPLMASDIAVSMSSASDIAKNCADILIQGNHLSPLLEVFAASKKSNLLIKQNFTLSFFYNIIAVPFAMLGHITPFIGALTMALSSLSVTLNSLRMRKN